MNKLTDPQEDQENQYVFPYHYLTEYSEKISISKRWGWAIEYLGRIELIFNCLKDIDYKSYIDVGCGDGKLISILSGNNKNKTYLGLDYSKNAIDLANALNSSIENTRYRVFDVFTEAADEEFDVLSMVEVMEHIEPEKLPIFLNNSLKFLKKNGFFIGSVPSKHLNLIPKHYQHFEIEQLKKIFLSHDLKVVELFYTDSKNKYVRFLIRIALLVNSSKIHNIIFNYYKKNCLYNKDIGDGLFFICKK